MKALAFLAAAIGIAGGGYGIASAVVDDGGGPGGSRPARDAREATSGLEPLYEALQASA